MPGETVRGSSHGGHSRRPLRLNVTTLAEDACRRASSTLASCAATSTAALSDSCYRYSVAGNGIVEVHSTRVVAVWGIFDDQTPMPPAPDRAAYCAAHPNDFACF